MVAKSAVAYLEVAALLRRFGARLPGHRCDHRDGGRARQELAAIHPSELLHLRLSYLLVCVGL